MQDSGVTVDYCFTGEWGRMYSELDLTIQESRDSEYDKLEEERGAFIQEIEQRQADKRERGSPDKHADLDMWVCVINSGLCGM